MKVFRQLVAAVPLWALCATLDAQQPPPIRPIGPIIARAGDSLGQVVGVRQLHDGRLLVNDLGHHRLLLFDSSLARATVVADSSTATNKAYGSSGGGIIAYRGDSTLFVDVRSESFLVIDPTGKIVRVMAVPDASHVNQLTGNVTWGTAAFDARGRLVYGYGPRYRLAGDTVGQDSLAVVRADLATRVIDTAGFIHMDLPRAGIVRTDSDGYSYAMPVPARLIPATDDWGVTADGAIAFVRSQDYHIEWVAPDGTRRSTPKMAHMWERLTDSMKAAITDSERTFLDAHPSTITVTTVDGQAVARKLYFPLAPASDLPDYLPPIRSQAVRADADGNLWIHEGGPPLLQLPGLPSPPRPPIYDVVDRNGRVVDRVEIPGGTNLVGFGPGVAYLTSRDGDRTSLVRVRIR